MGMTRFIGGRMHAGRGGISGALALCAAVMAVAAVVSEAPARGQTLRFDPVVRVGDVAPGAGGGTYESVRFGYLGPVLNDRGDVAFFGVLNGGTSTNGVFLAAATGAAGALSVSPVLFEGQAIPGGGTFSGPYPPTRISSTPVLQLNNNGDVLAGSRLANDTGGGLFLKPAGAPIRTLVSSETVNPASVPPPNYPGTFIVGGGAYVNGLRDDGTAVYYAASSADGGQSGVQGLFVSGASPTRTLLTVEVLASPNSGTRPPAPGFDGGYFDFLNGGATVNGRGDIAFDATIGRDGSDALFSAVYVTSLTPGAPLTYVAGTGTVVAGSGGASLRNSTSQTLRAMNDSGTILMRQFVIGGAYSAGPTAVDTLLLAAPGMAEVIPVASVGFAAPVSVGGTFNTIGSSSLDNRGRVLFYATLRNATTSAAIFQYENGVVIPLIKAGDPLFGSTISTLRIGHDALNEKGQFAFLYTLMNGQAGIALASSAVPEPGAASLVAPSLLGPLISRVGARRRRGLRKRGRVGVQ